MYYAHFDFVSVAKLPKLELSVFSDVSNSSSSSSTALITNLAEQRSLCPYFACCVPRCILPNALKYRVPSFVDYTQLMLTVIDSSHFRHSPLHLNGCQSLCIGPLGGCVIY